MEWLLVPLGGGLLVVLAFRLLGGESETTFGSSITSEHRRAVQATNATSGGMHEAGGRGVFDGIGSWIHGVFGGDGDSGSSDSAGGDSGGGGDGGGD